MLSLISLLSLLSLSLSSPLHLRMHVTYQHEWVREYDPVELDDVLMVEGAHGVGFLDELSLHLLLPVECFHCHRNLHAHKC